MTDVTKLTDDKIKTTITQTIQ